MKKCIVGLLVALGIALTVNANDALLRADHPDRYTVVKGDTLWDISNTFLKSPWLWPEIWHVNPQIDNPHLIFPGDIVSLVYIDGQPRLTVNRTVRLAPGTAKLSPRIYESAITDAIPAIPLDEINSFLSRTRIVTDEVLDAAPYVLAGAQKHLILGAGDNMYARGTFPSDIPAYGVYRKGDRYVDPETKELLGVQAMDIGTATMKALDKEVATLTVNRTTQEVRVGDRLLPDEERAIDSTFFPSSPSTEIEGVIMAVEEGVTQVGMLDIVMVNRGEREGLAVGNVMAIYKRGESVKDRIAKDTIILPEERAGLLMVFRTFEKMSLAIVLKADRALSVDDIVRNP